MTDFGQAVAWMLLSPFAFLTNLIAIFVITHYKTYFHGTDIAFLSLFITMALNAVFVLPIPAVVRLQEIPWTPTLCNFFVWTTVTFRVSHLLDLLCMSFHWMTVLRIPSAKQVYSSTKVVKIVIGSVWFLAFVIGLLPVIGATKEGFQDSNQCRFLPYDLGAGFALFFIVLDFFTLFMCAICTFDTVLLLRYMKRVAVVKYQAGRFYLPSASTVANSTGNQTVHARYNELNFSSDLCRLVLFVIAMSATINHFPYTIIEFTQLVQTPDLQTVENAVLWLILLEALTLPHALWLISKRYRHALIYTWKVFVMRDSAAEEEDPSACTLQSYTRRVRDADGKTVKITARVHGQRTILTSERDISYPITNGQLPGMNGDHVTGAANHVPGIRHNGIVAEVMTTDLDDGLTVITNANSRHVTYDVAVTSDACNTSVKSSNPTSPSKSSLSTPSREQDLKRTSSACSRKEWKEQMRRKHLPAIFVNEAFDSEDIPNKNPVASPKGTETAKVRHTGSDVSLHYYMSSDYHHDYLTDNLPRLRHQPESESEGASNQYDENDIEHILDKQRSVMSDSNSMSLDMEEAFQEALNGVTLHYTGLNTQAQTNFSESQNETKPRVGVVSNNNDNYNHNETELKSQSSDPSITLEPYTEGRRPPWLEEADDSSARAMGEPLLIDSDTDTLKGSITSSVFKTMRENSDITSPDQFDNDIDRGFEEALDYHYEPNFHVSSGLCFESIREEPEEDFSDDSPFHTGYNLEAVFKTQAVVSRPSSRASMDNPSERPNLDGSRESVSMNGFAEPITEERGEEEDEELKQYEQNYKGPLTNFGRFYNNPYPEEPNDRPSLTSFDNSVPEGTSAPSAERQETAISSNDAKQNDNNSSATASNRPPLISVHRFDESQLPQSEGVKTNSLFPNHNGELTSFGKLHKSPSSTQNHVGIPSVVLVDDNTSRSHENNSVGHWNSHQYEDDPTYANPSHYNHFQSSDVTELNNRLSPWPNIEDEYQQSDWSFESDFSDVSVSTGHSNVLIGHGTEPVEPEETSPAYKKARDAIQTDVPKAFF